MTTDGARDELAPGQLAEVREGDAYDLMAKLPSQSVDLIITSPPYWGLRTYGMAHNENILEEWIRWRKQGNCTTLRLVSAPWWLSRIGAASRMVYRASSRDLSAGS